jgi:hypothetical protein
MAILIILAELAILILVIAWVVGWRRENRDQLTDVQNHLLTNRNQPQG